MKNTLKIGEKNGISTKKKKREYKLSPDQKNYSKRDTNGCSPDKKKINPCARKEM